MSRFDVWEYDRDDEALPASTIIAKHRLSHPDCTVELVSARGDHLTVRVVAGTVTDPAAILYVERHGKFGIERIEPCPDGRVLLLLRALPARR